jgi:hypothetical protein
LKIYFNIILPSTIYIWVFQVVAFLREAGRLPEGRRPLGRLDYT